MYSYSKIHENNQFHRIRHLYSSLKLIILFCPDSIWSSSKGCNGSTCRFGWCLIRKKAGGWSKHRIAWPWNLLLLEYINISTLQLVLNGQNPMICTYFSTSSYVNSGKFLFNWCENGFGSELIAWLQITIISMMHVICIIV